LKQAQAGELTRSQALARIQAAQRELETVLCLLRDLGENQENLPLTTRYLAVMNEPIDLSAGADLAEKRGALMMAVSQLMNRFHRQFLG
jgi:hypothetical protein